MRSDRIAHLYEDPGPFATGYVDVSRDTENAPEKIELQVRTATDAATQAGAPESVVAQLREALLEPTEVPAPTSRFAVVTERGVLLNEVVRARLDQPSGSWGPLPDLGAWISDEAQTVPFVLALVDHEGGDVSVHRTGTPDRPDEVRTAGGETEFEHKVRGGGWAHLKWQHYNESVWARNARSVAQEITEHVRAGIRVVLLAGQPGSRQEVLTGLEGLQGVTVVELDAGGRGEDGGDEALQKAVARAVEEQVMTARVEMLDDLQERLGRDDAVATGVTDVVDAFVRGQVATLLIDPTSTAEHEVETARFPGLALGALPEVPERVRADQALLAAAALTGAEVHALSGPMLSGAPSAALLRWDQPTEGSHA